MKYQELIQPIDFSALFQLAFTLYAAFIAIEYARSFTAQVINRFYDFQGEIRSRIGEIMKQCRNEEMLNIESDDYFMSGEGLCMVDEYKQKLKDCEDSATEIESVLDTYVKDNTEYRIFRHFSLFMMLFSFTLMMAGGIYRVYPLQTIHFILSFIAFGLLAVIVGWVCAANRSTQSCSEKTSIIVVGALYVFSIVISCLSLWFHLSWDVRIKECLWSAGVVCAVILPFINFLFFFILVTFQIGRIRKYCEQSYQLLIQQCREAGELMVKLLHFQEVKNTIAQKKEKGSYEEPKYSSEQPRLLVE